MEQETLLTTLFECLDPVMSEVSSSFWNSQLASLSSLEIYLFYLSLDSAQLMNLICYYVIKVVVFTCPV